MMVHGSLVVLAAGMGSRYGGLKQMAPVGPNGELLIEYSIHDALLAGFRHVVFVIQKDQESAFRELLRRKLTGCCDISYAHQEVADLPSGIAVPPERQKPWGTGHAVLSCRDVVDGPFAVINADDFYGRDSYAQIADFLGRKGGSTGDAALVGFDLKSTLSTHGTVSRGVCRVDKAGFLISIEEQPNVGLKDGWPVSWDSDGNAHNLPGDSIASMNMWAFPSQFMQELGGRFSRFLEADDTDPVRDEFFLPAAVGSLMEEGNACVRVLPTVAQWIGVTYREDLARVREAIQELIDRGVYPSELWAGQL